MAGIGFQLRKLAREDTISSVVAAAGHAAVIAAGPWLFTILSLAAISLLTADIVGLETLATFRVVIIYSFALSLVATAPVTIVATRSVADALWLKRPQDARPLLIGALAYSQLAVLAGLAVVLTLFKLPANLAIALAACSMLVGMIWVVLSFCGAVRDYAAVTLSFLIGLIVSLVAATTAAILGWGAAGMTAGFIFGLAVTFYGMTMCVLRTFPQAMQDPLKGLWDMSQGISRYATLALGSLCGTAGVWVDKWVFWASPNGEAVFPGGLVHAPLYDSAMFISSLFIIPALSAFVIRLETEFFDRYQQYFATIQSHGTLGQIEVARERLGSYTLDNLTMITITQAGLCAVLILAAPVIVEVLAMQFSQIAILRFGALGVVFQFIYIAATSVLLFFDRRRLFLALQLLFLVLNAGLAYVSIRLGVDYYGAGFFLATLLASGVAWWLASATFKQLNYLTFIGNNPSVGAASSGERRGVLGQIADVFR
jgi:polysaccharide biosynthesis protein PelG